MKYRELDNNGDYSFGRNLFLFNVEAVAQAVLTRLKHLYGEWWENTEDGLPLFEKILGVFATEENIKAIDLIITDRILNTEGVTKITAYESTVINRVYSAKCTIETEYGATELVLKDNLKTVELLAHTT